MTTKDEALRVAREEMARYLPILMRLEDSPLWSEFTAGLGIATTNGYVRAIRTIALAVEAPSLRVQRIDLTDEQRKAISVSRDVSIPGMQSVALGEQMTDEWLEGAFKRALFLGSCAPDEPAANVLRGFANRVLQQFGDREGMRDALNVAFTRDKADRASASGAVGETAPGLHITQLTVRLQKALQAVGVNLDPVTLFRVAAVLGLPGTSNGCEVSNFSSQVCALGTYGCTASHDSNGQENGNG